MAARGPRSLRAEVTERGVTVRPSRGGAWAFRATPRGFGCEGAVDAVGDASPVRRGERVEYARGGLLEWYVDRPRGLEQGFTIPASPECRRRGGSGLVITLGGGLAPVVSEDGREALLRDRAGRDALRYAELRAVDAAGRDLPARLEAAGGGLAIHVDDAGARYPVEIDPLMLVQEQQLLPDDGAGIGEFGLGVSVSGDTIFAGAPGAGADDGAVYVFTRTSAGWAEQQKIVPSQAGPDANFGQSVSVSGGTAIVGAVSAGDLAGAAYLFTLSGGTWAEAQTLDSPAPQLGAEYGSAVVVQGSTAVVGARDQGGGAAYVFTPSGGTWASQQTLANPGGVMDEFGSALALDGDTVIVGAPGAQMSTGAAYVFVVSGGMWTLQQVLTAADGMPDGQFGSAVAIAGDTALVGAPGTGTGAVYSFTRSGGVWTQVQEMTQSAGIGGFGQSVALGSAAAVVQEDSPDGAVYAYVLANGFLTQEATLPTGDTGAGLVGVRVAMDGNTVVAGAPGENGQEGLALVFDLGDASGDTCTTGGTCFSGYCVDGVCCTVPSCPAASVCNAAETCQLGTGLCTVTPMNDGTPCDGGPCTSSGTCQDGACVASVDVCAPPDACHDFGSCDPSSDTCFNPPKADGQPCPGGTCEDGACVALAGEGGGGGSGSSGGGCGCGTSGAPPGGGLAAVAGILLLARRRRGA